MVENMKRFASPDQELTVEERNGSRAHEPPSPRARGADGAKPREPPSPLAPEPTSHRGSWARGLVGSWARELVGL